MESVQQNDGNSDRVEKDIDSGIKLAWILRCFARRKEVLR